MSIVSRYISRHFLGPFFYALAVCSLLFIIGEFFELMRFFWNNDVANLVVVRYFLLRIPQITYQVMPLVSLLAAYFCFSILSRTNELTALRAAGLSTPRLIAPIIIFSLVICLVAALYAIFPHGPLNAESRLLKDYALRGNPTPPVPTSYHNFKVVINPRVTLLATEISNQGHRLTGVTLKFFYPNGLLRMRVDSESAEYSNHGVYHCQQAVIHRFFEQEQLPPPEGWQQLPSWQVPLELRPNILWQLATHTEETSQYLTLPQLADSISLRERYGFSSFRERIEFHSRLAYPFITFGFTLLGISFFYAFRQTGIAFGFGLALLASFLFWILLAISKTLGTQEILPPWGAGWAPLPTLLFFTLLLYSWRSD